MRIEAVFARVLLEQVGGVHRHRAVQKNRQMLRQYAAFLQSCDGVQQRLCAPDGKYRHHRHATACGEAAQGGAEFA